MSQLAPVRPLSRSGPRRATAPRSLRVVTTPAPQGNAWFTALCIVLLLGGFVGVLLLNTAMAKGSYTLRDLQQRSDALTDNQDSLRQNIDAMSGPGPLAKRAQSLGMVPAETPAFLRLSDGAVLGVAQAAAENDRFSVVTETSQLPSRKATVPTPEQPARPAVPAAPTAAPSATPTARPTQAVPTPTPTPAAPSPTPTPSPTTATPPTPAP